MLDWALLTLAGIALLDARGQALRSLRARFVGSTEHDIHPYRS